MLDSSNDQNHISHFIVTPEDKMWQYGAWTTIWKEEEQRYYMFDEGGKLRAALKAGTKIGGRSLSSPLQVSK